jgi:catechol 2,3-dioxygenase-like lactoylglutathione lyase family enzyme
MLDRVTVRAFDLAAAERFYSTVLGAIGTEPSASSPSRLEWDDFVLAAADPEHPPTRHLHIGFVAPSRSEVHEFWRAGVDAGYEDDGAPGERPEYTPTYFGAFLRDPDGNSAEAVHHADVRRGGHIDHLWIRVRDLEATSAFYAALAPHIGLRPGRSWKEGRQFRGAWATFSLVADGAPATENLHLAFPAPDREAVGGFRRAATEAGYTEVGLTSPREAACSACMLDPNGTRVESIFREGRA